MRILLFILCFLFLKNNSTLAQSKYDETWIFRVQVQDKYACFTVILQKDSLQQYTKGYIYTAQKRIYFDKIETTKIGFNLYLYSQFSMFICRNTDMIGGSGAIGEWHQFHFFKKSTKMPFDAKIEPYSNYLENTKKLSNQMCKGIWGITMWENEKLENEKKVILRIQPVQSNAEIPNHLEKGILEKDNTIKCQFEGIEGLENLWLEGWDRWNEFDGKGMCHFHLFDGKNIALFMGEYTKDKLKGELFLKNKTLKIEGKRKL